MSRCRATSARTLNRETRFGAAESRWLSHPKPPQSHPKATPKPPQSHILGIDSGVQGHPKATPRPPQGHPKATPRPPQGHTKATPRLHQGYTKATPRLHQGYTKATPRLHQGYTKATPRLHQGYTKATPRLHQGYTKATPKPPQSHPKADCLLPPSVYVRLNQAEEGIGINYLHGRIWVLVAQHPRHLRVPTGRLQDRPGPQETRPVGCGRRLLCHVGSGSGSRAGHVPLPHRRHAGYDLRCQIELISAPVRAEAPVLGELLWRRGACGAVQHEASDAHVPSLEIPRAMLRPDLQRGRQLGIGPVRQAARVQVARA